MDVAFGIIFSLAFLSFGGTNAEPAFCRRGFPISGKYQRCWQQATFAHEYKGFDKAHVLTPAMIEDYATHMCRIVKPIAMDCLAEETEACKEQVKILDIADESGGACLHSDLNPFFKINIINHLKPISTTSKCFAIGDSSYKCYADAGEKVLESGDSLVGISRFHKVADKFFNYIWDCHIKLFNKKSNICKNWQIPMLLALQKIAMPSLFGMHLNNEQVAKLELTPKGKAIVDTDESGEEVSSSSLEAADCGDQDTYMLLRVVKDKSEARAGDILVKITSKEDERRMNIVSGPSFSEEAVELVRDDVNEKGQVDLDKLRKKMQIERRRQKQINDYLKRIKNADEKRLREIAEKRKEMNLLGGQTLMVD